MVSFNIHPSSRLGSQHKSYYEGFLPYVSLTGIIRDIRIPTLAIFSAYMLLKMAVFVYLYAKSMKDEIFRSQNKLYLQIIFGLNFIDL